MKREDEEGEEEEEEGEEEEREEYEKEKAGLGRRKKAEKKEAEVKNAGCYELEEVGVAEEIRKRCREQRGFSDVVQCTALRGGSSRESINEETVEEEA